MRTAQQSAESLLNIVETKLPDQYAVWLPTLNLESGLLLLGFTMVAFIVVIHFLTYYQSENAHACPQRGVLQLIQS